MPRRPSLRSVLSGEPWIFRADPFPHYFAPELFKTPFAEKMSAAIREAVAEPEDLYQFGYFDASTAALSDQRSGPLGLFYSRPWLDLIAGVTGMEASPHLDGGVHHHRVNSESGEVHADFNPGHFPDITPIDGIVTSDVSKVSYSSGRIGKRGPKAVKMVRAVSILYYGGNDAWSPGDGGETGVYRRASDPVDRPALAIPPRDNTMLVFECTPYSYHSFITNRVRERRAVVMWLHRTHDSAIADWSASQLEGFDDDAN